MEKGNYTIIIFSEEFALEESFIRMLKKNNIKIKSSSGAISILGTDLLLDFGKRCS
ncbi:MAG: hypothetical protein ACPK85_14800 [Methanosarcina sp.]